MMKKISEQVINSGFSIPKWLNQKGYFVNLDFVQSLSFVYQNQTIPVYFLFVPEKGEDNFGFEKFAIFILKNKLYLFEMEGKDYVDSEFEDEIGNFMAQM